jgi:protein SCO1/2
MKEVSMSRLESTDRVPRDVGISLLALGLAVALLAGCSGRAVEAPRATAPAAPVEVPVAAAPGGGATVTPGGVAPPCCAAGGSAAAPAVAGDLPAGSLWRTEGEWVDATGAARSLSSLRGHPVLAAMIFTRCAAACPRIVEDMRAIEAALPPGRRARVRFLLASMDPDRDTPERLGAFARERGLELSRWTLVRAGPEDVRTLAAALGVRYERLESGDFAHSNRITLLDAGGVVAARLNGLGADAAPLLAALERLTPAAGPPGDATRP